jgi:hypothetical protein
MKRGADSMMELAFLCEPLPLCAFAVDFEWLTPKGLPVYNPSVARGA